MIGRGEDGYFTIWVLGLCIVLFFVAGLGIDLWRGFSDRRALAAMADSAAVAGASGIDVETFRDSGVVVLNQEEAIARADANLASQEDFDEIVGSPEYVVTDDAIGVTLNGTVDFTLLKIFMGGQGFTVRVSGRAEPRESA